MSTERDVTRIVRSWLRTDEHESADRVLDTVLDLLDATPQRRSWWPARRIRRHEHVRQAGDRGGRRRGRRASSASTCCPADGGIVGRARRLAIADRVALGDADHAPFGLGLGCLAFR